jgi:DNA-binding transcriptional MerR regulator
MEGLKIGQVAKTTGLTAKTIRYYELRGLLPEPARTESGYRIFMDRDVEQLKFIRKAKRLGFSLADIHGALSLHRGGKRLCIHVLNLLDRKLIELGEAMEDLRCFRDELTQLRKDSAAILQNLPQDSSICNIIERGVNHKGELALAWLEGRQKTKRRHYDE